MLKMNAIDCGQCEPKKKWGVCFWCSPIFHTLLGTRDKENRFSSSSSEFGWVGLSAGVH